MNETKEQIESIAALIGSTQAELNQLDSNIVGESTNLKRNSFDGKGVLQKRMEEVRTEMGGAPPPPPPPSMPPAGIHPSVQPVQPVQQYQTQPASYGSELTVILQKLVSIEVEIKNLNKRIDGIEYFDKKVIDSLTKGLQNKVKQVTIKLDDFKDIKQK